MHPVRKVGPARHGRLYFRSAQISDIALNANLAKLFCSNATELHDEPVAVSPANYDQQFTFQTSTEIMTGRGGGGGRRVLLPPM